MRTIKPLTLTALNAPFQHEGRVRLVVVVGAMVSLDGATIEPEQTLWRTLMAAPGSSGALDEIKPKVRGEALLSGFAFAPEGKPQPIVAARLQVGGVDKEVWAVGDRAWKLTGPTEAVPFEKMPVSYDRAFGGEGYAPNPGGKGYAPIKDAAGESVHPLPNLEIKKKLVTSPRDRPLPAGFAPLDPSWPQRMKKLGTYDRKWFETRYPEMAADFDPTYFNVAQEDQWIEGYWQGGEPFVLENLHPERPRIEGTVPALRARCLVTRRGAAEGGFDDVPLRCDTLWFFPHVDRLILLFRGGIDVADEEASDLVDVIAALEHTEAPRPLEHYQRVRAQRLDKDKGPLHSLRDADLLPAGLKPAKSGAMNEMRALVTTENLAQANMHRRAQRELDGMRAQLGAAGIDPDKHLPREVPPPAPAPDLGELADRVEDIDAQVDAARRQAETMREKAFADARALCKEHGIDLDQRASQAGAVGGPPRFRAADELARLKALVDQAKAIGARIPPAALQLDDPAFAERLHGVETATKEAYRQTAHLTTAAATLGEDESARVRREVEAALAAGESLAGRDLTGADLSGVDFSGRDLSGAFLEKTNLAGCSFRGASVERAVFTRADLTGADLHGARGRGANFGEAKLTGAKLTGEIDLTEAIFTRARLEGADLSGATLDRAQLSEIVCDGTSFARVKAKGLVVFKGDMRGLDLREAQIAESTLLRVDLSGADLSGASLYRTALLDVTARGARFRDARLDKFRVVKSETGSTLAGSDFRGATMKAANLRGVDLEGADLRDTDLTSADLSGCNLRGAQLEGARAVEARFVKADLTDANVARADLMDALLGGALVQGASFEEANLFRADAAKMKGDDRTSMKGANVKLVRVIPDRDRSAHG